MRNGRGAGVPGPDEVHIDYRAPVLGSRSVPRCDCQYTGVGDGAVQPAQFVDAIIDSGAQSRFVADISDSADATPAEFGDQTRRLGQVVLGSQVIFDLRHGPADVDENEIRTLLGES